jgi:hypothetical protein
LQLVAEAYSFSKNSSAVGGLGSKPLRFLIRPTISACKLSGTDSSHRTVVPMPRKIGLVGKRSDKRKKGISRQYRAPSFLRVSCRTRQLVTKDFAEGHRRIRDRRLHR